jgi:dienelactone hydrolase
VLVVTAGLAVSVSLALSSAPTAVPLVTLAMKSVSEPVKIWVIHYESHNGAFRKALVALPRWYGAKDHPPVPLIISPHGRGVTARSNLRFWGDLPARAPFAVVSPEGQGRRLPQFSWGYRGQIADLARMPALAHAQLPWLTISPRRIYAVGASMGGQEVLLLAARFPRLLAGVAAFDPISDLGRQYQDFPLLGCNQQCLRSWQQPIGIALQRLARLEVGGSPAQVPAAYAARSPITYADALADPHIPIELWWSHNDRVVIDQQNQTGRLFSAIRASDPRVPVESFVGWWAHALEMRARSALPLALQAFGLVPSTVRGSPPGFRRTPPPPNSWPPP